ncbi:histidine phosphatase family protein [Pelagovum pacificum]|uniref:Histidine phosphatase family protein n=1 Tax=Pelagovum pacificum TaxID=2588711 RepID=A0A5C5GG99_9RHOB|nr:histidine phosphatase family protein [Pelagovum pacificum]QQA43145.1 histidine phosphatase family protein [Pelagovum pacificum]TNY33713.1 histidine phosphatase family protein [Pelagovum pacificum]
MGSIILVRHGQANSSATDEAGYDRLSDLGRQQAMWLGEWMREQDMTFDRVLSGTLLRHRATAEAMGFPDAEADARLNEMDYLNLSRALQETLGVPAPGPDEFAAHIPQVLEAWNAAAIMGNETFESFEARVTSVIMEAAEPGVNVLCVTSGGVIGMAIRHLLGLDLARTAQMLLPIWNSSIHRMHVRPEATILAGFNAIPHLERADRVDARTHY